MMTDRERWQYWKALAERLEAERDAALDKVDKLTAAASPKRLCSICRRTHGREVEHACE